MLARVLKACCNRHDVESLVHAARFRGWAFLAKQMGTCMTAWLWEIRFENAKQDSLAFGGESIFRHEARRLAATQEKLSLSFTRYEWDMAIGLTMCSAVHILVITEARTYEGSRRIVESRISGLETGKPMACTGRVVVGHVGPVSSLNVAHVMPVSTKA